MGRPKKYDREDVLEKAMLLFWDRGFADTTIQDLEKATGVNKSGLYAEFSGKDDIFTSSLHHYYLSREGGEVLSREPLGWNNIERFLEVTARGWMGKEGCMLSSSIRELHILPTEARKIVIECRVNLEKFFEKNIAAEKTAMSSESLAEIVATFYSGFCIEQNFKSTKISKARRIKEFMQVARSM